MPGLIDLQTNLRSLSYGTGRGEPYVTRPLPAYDEDPGNPFLGADMFGRSGQLGRGRTDVERFTKYLTNGKGLLFNAKQIALEKTRPKTPYGPSRSFLFSTVLAQSAVQGTGIHFDRANSLNVDNDRKYEYRTKTFYSKGDDNRLALLYKSKISYESISPTNEFSITGVGNQDVIISYGGGPGSLGGLGRTTLKRATKTTTTQYDRGIVALTSNNISTLYKRSTSTGFQFASDSGGITNFTKILNEKSIASTGTKQKILGRITDYSEFNRAKTFKAGDPGNSKILNRQEYYKGKPSVTQGTDLINFKPIYSSNTGVKTETQSTQDMIKFYIAVLDNNDPEKKTYIHFRAYIEGLADNYSANWSGINYPGRGEEFYKYGGFTRDIGFSFKVHVASRAELFPTYQKLNYLASVMAPDYSSPGYMRGNIVELTVGDYLNDVPGVITNFNYNLSDEASWDIARNDDGTVDENSAELATLINVDSFSFKPIHKFLPQKAIVPENPSSKFISMGADAKGYRPDASPQPLSPLPLPTTPSPSLQVPN